MRTLLIFVAASLLVGCAATSGGQYAQVYDRKYNEIRLVKVESPGTFVGTSATVRPTRAPGQHP